MTKKEIRDHYRWWYNSITKLGLHKFIVREYGLERFKLEILEFADLPLPTNKEERDFYEYCFAYSMEMKIADIASDALLNSLKSDDIGYQ